MDKTYLPYQTLVNICYLWNTSAALIQWLEDENLGSIVCQHSWREENCYQNKDVNEKEHFQTLG